MVEAYSAASSASNGHQEAQPAYAKQKTYQGDMFEDDTIYLPDWPLIVRPGDYFPMAEKALHEGHPVAFEGFKLGLAKALHMLFRVYSGFLLISFFLILQFLGG